VLANFQVEEKMNRMSSTKWGFTLVLLLAVVVAMGGCHKKPVPINTNLGDDKKVEKSTGGLNENVNQDAITWTKMADMQTVYFDYDSFSLRPDAIKALNANAEVLKSEAKKNFVFQVEGHCDERGTQEYNLALGEKRAQAVRDYLIKVGVAGDRIVTISLGKEKPVAEGHSEEAWKQNRRCEFGEAQKAK